MWLLFCVSSERHFRNTAGTLDTIKVLLRMLLLGCLNSRGLLHLKPHVLSESDAHGSYEDNKIIKNKKERQDLLRNPCDAYKYTALPN